MFWNKSKPAVVPRPIDPSSLEKGKEPDRRSSFSSSDSSSQASPVKSLPMSLPKHPQSAYAPNSHSHSQTLSMHEHTEGEQSFKVLSPDRSTSRKAAGRLVRRYWFVFVVAFLATAAIIGAAAGLASKRHTVAEVYFSPAQISAGVAATWTSYVVIDQGTVLSTYLATHTPTPTPAAS